MISEIKNFIEAFFKKEVEARNAFVKPDVNFANAQLDELNSFCIPEVYDSFGIAKITFPNPPGFYQQHGKTIYDERKLFKISQYTNEKYNDLFFCYVSHYSDNYIKAPLSISKCLFIAKVEGELKIVRSFFFGGDGLIPEWNPSAGDRDISFKTSGKLIEIERYLEPKDDQQSMGEYAKNI